jgi:hypothetical protein
MIGSLISYGIITGATTIGFYYRFYNFLGGGGD